MAKQRFNSRNSNSNRRGKRNGKKYNPKEDYNSSDRSDTNNGVGNRGSNDASWYTRNSQLALDAGRLAFTWPTGAPVDMDIPNDGCFIDYGVPTRFPGAMVLRFAPTYGLTGAASDPLNVSAKNIYSYVRHANSGHSNYDAPDLMLYLLAVDNIYMFYQHMCRIYGLVRLFAQKNRHLPETILTAMGVDYNNILNNLADYRAYINTCAVKIGSLCVPNTMPLFTRHAWMCSGIYADSPSIKSQFYVFQPRFVGQYNEYNGAGYLDPISIGSQDFTTLKSTMDNLIAKVIESEDMNIMSGDILKAYGESNLLKISMISEDYMIQPQFNLEVLRQIQNATVLDGTYAHDTNEGMVFQDINLNILKSGIKFAFGSQFYGAKRIMTGTSESPTPEEVLVNSRLMVTLEPIDSEITSPTKHNLYLAQPNSCGSEVIVDVILGTLTANGSVLSLPIGGCLDLTFQANITDTSLMSTQLSNWKIASLISFFNYHPMFWFSKGEAAAIDRFKKERIFPYFDVDDYAIVDEHDIEKLHNTAMLSLLDVPQLGRV